MNSYDAYEAYKNAEERCNNLADLAPMTALFGLGPLAIIWFITWIIFKNTTLNWVIGTLALIALSFSLACWVMSLIIGHIIDNL